MKIVYRYEANIPDNDIFSITVPIYSETLRCDIKDEGKNIVSVWCLVDPDEKMTESKVFRICGTGHPIKTGYDLKYINTISLKNKLLWFHFFEIVG